MNKDNIPAKINIQHFKDTFILTLDKRLGKKNKDFMKTLSDSLIKSGIGFTIGIITLILLKADFMFYPLSFLLTLLLGIGYPILKETYRNKIQIYIDSQNLYIPKQISKINLSEIKDIQTNIEKINNDLLNVKVLIIKRNGKEEEFYLNEITEEEMNLIVSFVKDTVERNKNNLPPLNNGNHIEN